MSVNLTIQAKLLFRLPINHVCLITVIQYVMAIVDRIIMVGIVSAI